MLSKIKIFLAEDDEDDCFIFKEALDQLKIATTLKLFENGELLMNYLIDAEELPQMVFMDINMPRKDGFTCITEMKQHEKLKALPVIILSTSCEKTMINRFYKSGALFYICKPIEFSEFKNLINTAITRVLIPALHTEENFVILPYNHHNEIK